MQRHWEGVHIQEEIQKRDRQLSSIALLARQDVDGYIWLSDCRPGMDQSAPHPPGAEQMVAETKVRKKKSVCGTKARRKTCFPNRCGDDLVHSRGRSAELSDLLQFFSTLDIDLQKLLLDAIANHNSKEKDSIQKVSAQKDGLVHKDGRKTTGLAWEFDHKTGAIKDYQPTPLARSSCSTARLNSNSSEALGPCSFREWQPSSCDNEKFGTDEFSDSRSQTAEWTCNSSCQLTNSSGPLGEGCGKADTQDGVCRDVAIQTRRSLRKGSKSNLKGREQSRETPKSLADHSSQEEELREKWLTPEERQSSTPTSGAQTGDLESTRVQHISNSPRASETQMMRVFSDRVEAQLDEPLSNRKYGGAPGDELTSRSQLTDHGAFEPILDKSNQEDSVTHESRVKPSTKPDLWPTDHFHKPRPEKSAANSASGPKRSPRESESLRGKPKHEYLAADFRTRKLVEWWPTNKSLQTTKSKSAPGVISSKSQLNTVYDPANLLGKSKRDQISGDRTRQKPEWWPALRRPYSASEIEAMRQKEDTEKATRKPPIRIATGYPLRRLPTQSSNKSQRRTAGTMELTRMQCTQECMAQQDDSLKRTLQRRTAPPPSPPLRRNHQEEHRKKMEALEKAYGHFQKTDRPRNLSTVNALEQLTIRKSPKCKTGHGGLHALQENNQFKMQCPTLSTSITVEEHVCGIITHLKDQVCGIMTQFQPQQDLEVASYLLHQIETPREANIPASALSQNAQQEFPKVTPVVELHNEEHEVKKTRKQRKRSNSSIQRGIERLADKLIDQAVNEVATELAEFCETVADQMYMAEFMT
ncbi:hypothetical protein KC19_1G300600 [Ceratodon purpureus]|uniref:Uncharacterized protein n=1 Tax=Ceratodon purpureus TaxID=3225 RepID=A0A8T0JDA5_CERPU|nr:hypothetical protein KC19_1G300600 [Ceratodon purpureus]